MTDSEDIEDVDAEVVEEALAHLREVAPVTPWTPSRLRGAETTVSARSLESVAKEYDDLSAAVQDTYEVLAAHHPDYDADVVNWTERDHP